MSKFDELCQAFGDARNNWFAYRDRCQNFGGHLVSGFLKYLETPDSVKPTLSKVAQEALDVPERLATWTKKDVDGKPVPAAVFEAIRLEDDGYWHATFMLTVYERPTVFPYQPLLLEVAFKPSEAGFRVRLSEDDPEIAVTEGNQDTLDNFNEALFSRIKNYFEDSTDWEKEGAPPPRKIGFRPGEV